ncbi:MAG TPA: hypothetical protein VIY27_07825 [Myxococcota bacterium]
MNKDEKRRAKVAAALALAEAMVRLDDADGSENHADITSKLAMYRLARSVPTRVPLALEMVPLADVVRTLPAYDLAKQRGWVYDDEHIWFEHDGHEYWFSLDRCRTPRQACEWIFQLSRKAWCSPEVLAGLVYTLRRRAEDGLAEHP